jgi:DNA-binding NarL/FixJ family response regulator
MTPLRVLIADDDPVVSDALTDLLAADAQFNPVGAVRTTAETVKQATALQPDIVVMDVKMPGGGGVTAAREIRDTAPGTKVVAFSAYQDRHSILNMLNAGAVGYVIKGGPASELMAAIRVAGRGGAVLFPGASAESRPRTRGAPARRGGSSATSGAASRTDQGGDRRGPADRL